MATPQEQSVQYQIAHAQDDRSAKGYAINLTLVGIATIAVVLRMWARRLARAPFMVDDYAVLVALVIVWIASITDLIGIHYGYGKHAAVIGLPRLIKVAKATWAYELVYQSSIGVNKIAILLLYHRIFAVPKYRKIFMALGVYVILFTFAASLVLIFQCHPVSYYWNRSQPGRCIDAVKFIYWVSSFNILADVLILISPIPCVWNLNTSRQQKFMISAMFLLGGFVCIASVVRMVYIKTLISLDPSWISFPLGMWSLVEPDVGLVCACVPVMRPLFRRRRKGTNGAPSYSGYSHDISAPSKKAWSRSGQQTMESIGSTNEIDQPSIPLAQVT